MKFVNKLSVLSLVVLIFSFMNIAQAADCSGTGVSSCAASKTDSACGTTYRTTAPSYQCKWDAAGKTCRANGNPCGKNTTPAGKGQPGDWCKMDSDCFHTFPGCGIDGKCIAICAPPSCEPVE